MTSRHATANIAKELTGARVRADVQKVAQAADVVGWQEMGTPAHVTALLDLSLGTLGPPGTLTNTRWGVFWPGGLPRRGVRPSSANLVPISWRRDRFTLVSSGAHKCIEGVSHVTPARFVVWVILRDLRTGGHLARINGHNIQQAWTSHPERRDEWRTWAAYATRKTNELAKTYPTIGSADLNRNHWMMPGARMCYASHGTFGGSYYDAVWLDGPVAGVPSNPPARIGLNSDHDALVTTVRV